MLLEQKNIKIMKRFSLSSKTKGLNELHRATCITFLGLAHNPNTIPYKMYEHITRIIHN